MRWILEKALRMGKKEGGIDDEVPTSLTYFLPSQWYLLPDLYCSFAPDRFPLTVHK